MKTSALFQQPILATIVFAHGLAFSQTTITYDVSALIDVSGVLIIQGSEAQWYHPGSGGNGVASK